MDISEWFKIDYKELMNRTEPAKLLRWQLAFVGEWDPDHRSSEEHIRMFGTIIKTESHKSKVVGLATALPQYII